MWSGWFSASVVGKTTNAPVLGPWEDAGSETWASFSASLSLDFLISQGKQTRPPARGFEASGQHP